MTSRSYELAGREDRSLHLALLKLVVADILMHVDDADRDYFSKTRTTRMGKSPSEIQTRSPEGLKTLSNTVSTLRAALDGQDFICGNTPGYGDYITFGAFAWAREISDFELIEKVDPVYAWRARLLDMYEGMARSPVGCDV